MTFHSSKLSCCTASNRRLQRLLLLCVLLILSPGCKQANELGRQAVSGSVTIDRAPLEAGSIMFSPDQPNGVSSGAEIRDGQYSIAAHQGLTPGTYTVRVYATDVQAEAVEPVLPGPGIKTQPERIPAKYNLKSELKLEVVESTEAKFDLDVISK